MNFTYLQKNLVFFVCYLLLSWLGFLLVAPINGGVSNFYPAAGFALAGAVKHGKAIFPSLLLAVIISSVYSNWELFYTDGNTIHIVAIMTIAIVVQTYIGAFCLNALLPNSWQSFRRVRDLILFLLVVLFLCSPLAPILVQFFNYTSGIKNAEQALISVWFCWLGQVAGIIILTPIILKVGDVSKDLYQKLKFSFSIAIFSVVSWGLIAFAHDHAKDLVMKKVDSYQQKLMMHMNSEIKNSVNSIEVISHYLMDENYVEEYQFNKLTDSFLLEKNWVAISYNALVQDSDRLTFEQQLSRVRGEASYIFEKNKEFKPIGVKPRYLVVKYINPKEENKNAIGYDISSDTQRKLAIDEAIKNRRSVVSSPINLIQSGHKGLLLMTPTINQGEVQGLIVGVIDIEQMMTTWFSQHHQEGIFFEITDITNGEEKLLYSQVYNQSNNIDLSVTKQEIAFFGKNLRVTSNISDKYFASNLNWVIFLIPLINLFILVLYCYLILMLWANKDDLDIKVDRQTKLLKNIHEIQSSFIVEHNSTKVFQTILDLLLSVSSSQIGFIANINHRNKEVLNILAAKSNVQGVEADHNIELNSKNLTEVFSFLSNQNLPFICNLPNKIPDITLNHKLLFSIDSCLFLPIFRGNKLVATVALMNTTLEYNNESLVDLNLILSTCGSILSGVNEKQRKNEVQLQLKKNLQEKNASQQRVIEQANALAIFTNEDSFKSGNWKEAVNLLTSMICKSLSVQRASVWLFNEDRTELYCHSLSDAALSDANQVMLLSRSEYPRYFEALETNHRISADDALIHIDTCEFKETYFEPLGISSMLDGGIIKDGRLIGVVCAEHVGQKRIWQPDEKNYINIVSGFASQLLYSTERNSIQQKLFKNQLEKAVIVDNMKEGVLTLNDSGEILTLNDAAGSMFGYRHTDFIGKNISSIVSNFSYFENIDNLQKLLVQSINHDVNIARTFEAKRSTGDEFPLKISVSELPSENNERRYLAICVDVTVEKQQEKYILHNQKMDAIGQLTGGVAHDFNNILGIMMGYSELISQNVSGKALSYIEQVLEAGDRAKSLTKELLAFASKKENNPQVVDLKSVLEGQRLIFEKALSNQVELDIIHSKHQYMIKVDVFELENALLNLMINAKHAMNSRGKLTISTSIEVLNELSINLLPVKSGKYVRLSISDTGSGMEEEVLKRLFEPFYTTKGHAGTGLGLAQVYGFLQRSEGSVRVESRVNVGTTFHLYFPLVEELPVQLDEGKEDKSYSTGSGTILIVDDEKPITDLFSMGLSRLGYKTFVANDAKTALDLMSQNKVDLLLSDIMMPVTNGIELANKVLKEYPSCKIQLMSGYSDKIDKSSIPAEIYSDRLIKPFSIKELADRIANIL